MRRIITEASLMAAMGTLFNALKPKGTYRYIRPLPEGKCTYRAVGNIRPRRRARGRAKAVATILAFAIGALAGMAADRAQAVPISDTKQYAMVQSAAEILGDAQCGVPVIPATMGRMVDNGIDFRGRDNAQFLVIMNAVLQIYLADPKGFCQRARAGQ